MQKTIKLPASILEYFVIQDNEVYSWYRIPATDYVAGMPAAILIPVSLPLMKNVKVTKKFVTITFLLETEEEQRAWKHTKAYIHQLFGEEEQPKRFPRVIAAAAAAVALATAVIAISANAERAVEVCEAQAQSIGMHIKNAYGANLCQWNMYRRTVQKEYDKLSK